MYLDLFKYCFTSSLIQELCFNFILVFLSVKHWINNEPIIIIIILCIGIILSASLIFPHVFLEPFQHRGQERLSESKDSQVGWSELARSLCFLTSLSCSLDDNGMFSERGTCPRWDGWRGQSLSESWRKGLQHLLGLKDALSASSKPHFACRYRQCTSFWVIRLKVKLYSLTVIGQLWDSQERGITISMSY